MCDYIKVNTIELITHPAEGTFKQAQSWLTSHFLYVRKKNVYMFIWKFEPDTFTVVVSLTEFWVDAFSVVEVISRASFVL